MGSITSQRKSEASIAEATAAATGTGITVTSVAAGIATGLTQARVAARCGVGVGLGAVAGVSYAAGTLQGGIIGNDKTRAVKSQNCVQAIKGAVEQTLLTLTKLKMT